MGGPDDIENSVEEILQVDENADPDDIPEMTPKDWDD
jgi:hypothetical protein